MPSRINPGRQHGLDGFYYVAYMKDQGGVCAICKEPPKPGKVLNWDHDHTHCAGDHGCPECIRALLCDTCNARVAFVERQPRFDPTPYLAYVGKWARTQPELS